jgi:hypothetical protein
MRHRLRCAGRRNVLRNAISRAQTSNLDGLLTGALGLITTLGFMAPCLPGVFGPP